MIKITANKGDLKELSSKYCRIVLTEEPLSSHRLVETSDKILEYRMGVGKFSKLDTRAYRTLVRSIIQTAKLHKLEYVAIDYKKFAFPKLSEQSEVWRVSTLIENLLMADYEFVSYKTKSKNKKELKEVVICGLATKGEKEGFSRGLLVGEYINQSREISNTPACDMTPTHFAEVAKKMAKDSKVSVKVLGEKELKKLKMGLLLAVGQGTKSETKFVVVEYLGAGKVAGKKIAEDKKPLVLVGKGITYDTGGLNVKPSGAMHDMHMDMSGGSTVLTAINCAARLKLKKNIVALIPLAENAVSDDAMRAGDIVTAMNGKTVEVLHTDAEGRMVLADALTYSERYQPKALLDVATLTGAALVALGQHASAIMTKDADLEQKLRSWGEESGDLVWPLPLWDEYKQHIKSNRADISNIAVNFSRFGGSIEGGTFLSFFAPKNVPWAHIDIAPRMDSIASDKLAKGSTGEPVRLLVKFLEEY
ncbi:MAG: leucyl aminopeptidase family protein [Candidatus Paceibacterota bacterium]